ncbi:flagellar motor switch protein [Clostridium carboxidivorans P7]|uniref:CheC, inhibitor of MCP methylation / FliN fusion protein n=1 Tax=Clostridium carboxidivorans P7 TaxID=536227 RepID=C6PPK0_9CLOT|nr:flagellar motor switch phosphatase FliY [Clostridium carboxidivorans]AKN33907.1 flagellar motor switch protein [Clostridium carboxidivorans P7]EET88894.1 CheC, inhibitor of MCP methylation / FliN fusion protein [Clostridium carboxidivorans P7]EFG88223.1 flagellar motor switch protein FliN [Clostridium carboxidivorans P7]
MSNGFLSQEEIDALLNGGGEDTPPEPSEETKTSEETPETSNESELPALTDIERDLLGEIGNISMGSASTALSTIINQQVNITTPIVTITRLKDLKDQFEVPNVALEVKYVSGIVGENLLVMKITDAAVIANLMMGGDGNVEGDPKELSEIELSAVSEAMNQMIGSAATSMATMFMREVNISPPVSTIWNDLKSPVAKGISEDEPIIKVSFSLAIGDLVDSTIMQILPIATAKKIVSIMMGQESPEGEAPAQPEPQAAPQQQEPVPQPVTPQQQVQQSQPQAQYQAPPQQVIYEKPIEAPRVEVKQAAFQPLAPVGSSAEMPKNIDLILDVPLDISVVLGRTKKNIKDILNLGTGSLIELDKLAEEPVEILVNGKRVAYGEVVVVDENFGVRITSIISSEERIKSLK